MKKKLKRAIIFFLPAIGWVILSTVLLTLPGSVLPKEGWLEDIYFDKWVHIGMFGTMVFFLCWGIHKRKTVSKKGRYFIICGLLCLGYGILMEFIQKYFIPNRSFDIDDMLADGTGCALGVWFCIRTYIKK